MVPQMNGKLVPCLGLTPSPGPVQPTYPAECAGDSGDIPSDRDAPQIGYHEQSVSGTPFYLPEEGFYCLYMMLAVSDSSTRGRANAFD